MDAITREEKLMDGQYVEPITRKEKILAGEDLETITREEYFLKKYRGGGGGATVEPLSVTENGTYTAPTGKAYSPVTVAVEGYAKKSIANTPTAIATFNASALPMPSLTVGIEAVQSGTGDPSPTNVRPFSGWSAVNVYDDPVYGGNINWNQLMQISSRPTGTNNDVLITNNGDGSFTLNGTASGNIYADIYTNFQNSLTANHIYMFVVNSTADTVRITNSYGGLNIVTSDKKIVKYISGNVYVALYVNTGVVVDNVSAYPQCLDLTMIFGENKAEEILAMEQAETGSGVAYVSNLFPKTYYTYNAGTKTCVSAVNGDTYGLFTTQLKDGQGNPMVCYGGQLVNENGVQTLDNAKNMVDLGTLNWSAYNIPNVYYAVINDFNTPTNDMMCTQYKVYPYTGQIANMDDFSIRSFGNSTEKRLFLKDTAVADVTALVTKLNGVQLVYPLATPTQIPQDSLSIATQEGVNNLCADSGDIQSGEYFEEL